MTDDLEPRLRAAFRQAHLPAAPASLHERLHAIAAAPPVAAARTGTGRSGATRLLIGLAAVLAIGTATLVGGLNMQPAPPTFPPTVDGMPVMTVSEALAAHTAGTLPGSRAAIRGWWSNGRVGHSCGPATIENQPGDLEIYCSDGEYGITEREEPIYVVDVRGGLVTYEAQGPHLTPYIEGPIEGIEQLFDMPIINGQRYPPVPILVVGHFDDPRAALCRADKRQLCLDRLVLERVVAFEIGSVPTPGVTPSPTPFPSDLPGLFGADECAGDVPYTFESWTTPAELGIDRGLPGEHIWAMITRDPVDRSGEWIDDGSGQRYRHFGRLICLRDEHDADGVMGLETVPGTEEIHWQDGLVTPGSEPIRPPAAS